MHRRYTKTFKYGPHCTISQFITLFFSELAPLN